MKIVTLTLAHAGAADLLPDALASAGFADEHFVIDTSPGKPEVQKALEGVHKVRRVAWTWQNDFSAARNFALRAVGNSGDWGVILDSDERLHLDERFDLREALACHDGDVLLVASRDGTYVKDRFFRLPVVGPHFVGPTHEVCIGWANRQTLRGVRFSELGKTWEELKQKRLRDEKILKEHTKRNPKDPRWFYYLGDTLAALDKRQAAIDAFNRCLSLRGWADEGAWAAYRSAELSIMLENFDAAVETAAKGLARHAGVAELAWMAALASTRAGRQAQATYWARMSVALGCYKGCGKNVTREGFKHVPALYELPYDILRHSTQGEEKIEAEREFDLAKEARFGKSGLETALNRNADDSIRDEARSDIALLSKPLSELCESVVMKRLTLDEKILGGYRLTNPSVATHEGKLLCVVRSVNYEIVDGRYVMPDEDHGVIKTQNYLVELSSDLQVAGPAQWIRDMATDPRFPSLVLGYEDLRLISVGGRLHASATVRDRIEDCRCEIAILDLDANADVRTAHVQRGNDHEKNWMPIAGQLSWIYKCDPTLVIRYNPSTEECDDSEESIPALGLDHLRGGSQLVPYGDGFLCVAHEVVYRDSKRVYLHRFVRFGPDFRILAVTDPWVFHGIGIEFCAGLAQVGEKLVLSYGLKDSEAWALSMDVADVTKLRWRI